MTEDFLPLHYRLVHPNTHLSIVLNSLSLSLTFSSCEPLLFDDLMCTAAVVTPESHQILVSLSDTLSRLSPTI